MIEGIAMRIDALLQGLAAEPAEPPAGASPRPECLESSAVLAAYVQSSEGPQPESPSVGAWAAFLDGTLSSEEAASLVRYMAGSQGAWLELEAVRYLLEHPTEKLESAPEDVVQEACSALERARGVRVLRSHAPRRSLPAPESFLPLVASSHDERRPLCCRSQSGIWMIEVFIGDARQEPHVRCAHLLLTVQADHRTRYEGLTARVYVGSGENKRALAEQVVRNGEIFAEFELRDLDFWTRDAVSVVFEPAGPQG